MLHFSDLSSLVRVIHKKRKFTLIHFKQLLFCERMLDKKSVKLKLNNTKIQQGYVLKFFMKTLVVAFLKISVIFKAL